MKYVFSLIDDALEHELWHADQSSEALQLFFKKIYFFFGNAREQELGMQNGMVRLLQEQQLQSHRLEAACEASILKSQTKPLY
jgi:hypothetical protein